MVRAMACPSSPFAGGIAAQTAGTRPEPGTLWRRGRPAAPEEPTLAMDTHAAIQPVKPRLRGRLHQIAFFVVVPAGVALVAAAPTTRSRVATLDYALSLAGLYGTSAAYHRIPWSPGARRWMKRMDH